MTQGGAAAGDERFFGRARPQTLRAIAAAAGGALDPAADAERLLHGAAGLSSAGPLHLSFLDNRRYAEELAATGAGAVIVRPDMVARVPAGCVAITTPEPYLGWARAAALFHPPPPVRPGVHPSAVVDPSCRLDPSAEVGPLAVLGAGSEIGPRCRIGPHAVIGEGVVLGPDCRIGAHASISHALLGARVYVYPGARIGQEGFGFAQGPDGFVTVPQLGRVVVGDDVEIGANSAIDRGSTQDTVIGAGSRLDNLVQIGHNVRLGRGCVIVAQAGISGSTVLDDFVTVAAQAGLVGHLRIGRAARIGAQAGVMRDVPAAADVLGSPAVPVRTAMRQFALLRRMAERAMGGAAKDADEKGGDETG